MALELLLQTAMTTGEFAEIPTEIYEPYDAIEVREVSEVCEVWPAESTTRVFDLEGKLEQDEKVAIGYLTMEQQGWFDGMSPEEQESVIAELKKS
jgi:hypothetical protein